MYTKDDQVEVTFDGFQSGSEYASNYSFEENTDNDILNTIKDGMKIKEHMVDIDLTTWISLWF